jgi:hypothetical protein
MCAQVHHIISMKFIYILEKNIVTERPKKKENI